MPGPKDYPSDLNTVLRGLRQLLSSTSEGQQRTGRRNRDRNSTREDESSLANSRTLPLPSRNRVIRREELMELFGEEVEEVVPSRREDELEAKFMELFGKKVPPRREGEPEAEYVQRALNDLLEGWIPQEESGDDEESGRGRSRGTGRKWETMEVPGPPGLNETHEEYAKPKDGERSQGFSSSSGSNPSYTQASQEQEQSPCAWTDLPPHLFWESEAAAKEEWERVGLESESGSLSMVPRFMDRGPIDHPKNIRRSRSRDGGDGFSFRERYLMDVGITH